MPLPLALSDAAACLYKLFPGNRKTIRRARVKQFPAFLGLPSSWSPFLPKSVIKLTPRKGSGRGRVRISRSGVWLAAAIPSLEPCTFNLVAATGDPLQSATLRSIMGANNIAFARPLNPHIKKDSIYKARAAAPVNEKCLLHVALAAQE